MGLGKQAKIMSKTQERAVLSHLESTRYPLKNRVLFLLSIKSGLRAKEISSVTWAMVTDSDGDIAQEIRLENTASKGDSGRVIPLNAELRASLVTLYESLGDKAQPHLEVIRSERGRKMTAQSVSVWFSRVYRKLGMEGCSSHSGRRTFGTRAAKAVVGAGGSLKDVQELLGHSSLAMTQRYIQGSEDAKQKVVDLL
ncbi:MAG: site-specific integrase [Magnetococcales bacterium]|nr:site-specific integrase [Magnetococcales bacterium]